MSRGRPGVVRGAIRAATRRDLDRVVALWEELAAHHARLDPLFRLRRDADARIRSFLAEHVGARDAALFVYDLERDLAGFCAVRALRAPPVFEETERAEISDLAVRVGRRRQGIGRALVDRSLVWTEQRGLERVEVRVASSNREGQAFWRALGFGDLVDVLQRRL